MSFWRLIQAGFLFHFRLHLGVVSGTAVAGAVLVGALAVGDSVRSTLLHRARVRLGTTEVLAYQPDRFFPVRETGAGPGVEAWADPGASVLLLPASISRADGSGRVNRIQLLGVEPAFFERAWRPRAVEMDADGVWVNGALARRLRLEMGDDVILRMHKPSALSLDAVISPRDDQSVALRRRVAGVLDAEALGDFQLAADQAVVLNAFVDRTTLARVAGQEGRANLFVPGRGGDGVAGVMEWERRLRSSVQLEDLELGLVARPVEGVLEGKARWIELNSRRIFMEPGVVAAAEGVSGGETGSVAEASGRTGVPGMVPILTYLVNGIRHGEERTPYSMVTAAGPPFTPGDMGEDEIVVNEWLAADLGLEVGDWVTLEYYRVDSGSRLEEKAREFRVRAVVPLGGWHGDRGLMPEFPGLSKAESTHEWDAGFDLVHTIRDKDEAYWKAHRGTPKAFVTPSAGRGMWGNKFGEWTALRWLDQGDGPDLEATLRKGLVERLDPAQSGWRFQPAAAEARAAAAGGQDFGELFLGFSFFLIVAALLLTVVLFQFGLEQRAGEIGLYQALGWTLGRVRRLYWTEGLLVAVAGAAIGIAGGVAYGRGVIWGLNTLWSEAVAGAELQFALSAGSAIGGGISGVVLAALTIGWALRVATRRPARELLNEGMGSAWGGLDGRKGMDWGRWVAWGSGVLCLGLVAAGFWMGERERPGLFLGSGALGLVALLLGWWSWLQRPGRRASEAAGGGILRNQWDLVLRAPARQPKRSVAVAALLAGATFLLTAVAANRLDATLDAGLREGGTGGFALWAESTLPVVEDLNSARGRERLGLDPADLEGVSVVPFRVRDGDDASCLNLNRAQRPRLLGLAPDDLTARGAFRFQGVAKGLDRAAGWGLLGATGVGADGVPEVPAIGDANSIQWALGRTLGDTIEYEDAFGRPFRIRLVGAVANSILQGNLVIAESEFVRRFPGEPGHRVFLVDIDGGENADGAAVRSRVAAVLARALQDLGWESVDTVERLAAFNAVQNTYLNTFLMLGGLGLFLGSFGLGTVVFRNVFERRGELGVLQALGYDRARVRRLILWEHLQLLAVGMGVGLLAALIPLLPVLGGRSGGFPWISLGATLGVVLLNGVAWTLWATWSACRGSLLLALRGE